LDSIFVILINNILIVKEGELDLCRQGGRGAPLEGRRARTAPPEREREVYHHKRERTTNHTVVEERGAQVALPDRGGGLNLCHRRGEVRTITLPKEYCGYLANYYNYF
jgi:hypothetical protein